jgi:DNA-binding protein YbaB
VVAPVTDHQAEVERLLADYRRSREQLAAVCRALAEIVVSQSSSDGTVTVTVGAQGVLTGLHLEPDAYRWYRPADLAALIVRLAAVAAEQAATSAQRVIEPVLPPGIDPAAVLAGTADLRPRETAPPAPREADDSLDGRTWLEHAHRGRRAHD